MMRQRAAATVAVLFVACGEAPPPAQPDDPADLPMWTATRELEIGHEDDPDYALTPVGGLAVSPAGEVFVSQPQDRHIRVFDRDGRFLRAIGRRGEGPGEFVRLGEVGFLGDTLWAVDVRSAAFLQFFTPGGRSLGMRRVPAPEAPYLGGGRYYPLPDGGVLMPTATGGELMVRDHEQPWLHWDARDSLVARLPGYHATAGTILDATIVAAGRSIPNPILVLQPLSARSWVGLSPDASTIVRAEYDAMASEPRAIVRVVRYTPRGDTLASASLLLPRQSVDPSVVDSLKAAELARVGRVMGVAAARRALEGVFRVPASHPPLRRVFVDADAHSWLELDAADTSRWLLLDPDLTPTAWLELPARFRPWAAAGDELWGVERDDLDVPRVIRLRIGPGRGG